MKDEPDEDEAAMPYWRRRPVARKNPLVRAVRSERAGLAGSDSGSGSVGCRRWDE